VTVRWIVRCLLLYAYVITCLFLRIIKTATNSSSKVWTIESAIKTMYPIADTIASISAYD